MTIEQIIILVAAVVLYLLLPRSWRHWLTLLASYVCLFWFQPTLPVRWLDYSLPVLTIAITIVCWFVIRIDEAEQATSDRATDDAIIDRQVLVTLFVTGLFLVALTLPRYVQLPALLTSRPPPLLNTLLVIAAIAVVLAAVSALKVKRPVSLWIVIATVISLFLVTKYEPLTLWLSSLLRSQSGQDVMLASSIDIRWLGYSYIAFRLIHTLRNQQMSVLIPISLREYLTYVLFFPALVAGPIARAEDFVPQLRSLSQMRSFDAARIQWGVERLALGLFKKFVLADSLAVISLNDTLALQITSPVAMWISLYAYALRIFLDFSGYIDIAIGLAALAGIRLPENFLRPYLAANITIFWKRWHITLSEWVQTYLFSPISRTLLKRKWPSLRVVIVANTVAMVTIGLWHGVTLPFLLWGLWHACALSLHKFWQMKTRVWQRKHIISKLTITLWQLGSVLVTFHIVVLGWVLFVLTEPATIAHVFRMLLFMP